MEAVSVLSRHLLVLEPFAASEWLTESLQAAGWTLQPCTPETVHDHFGDALLLHLDQQPGHIRNDLRHAGLACVALVSTQLAKSNDIEELLADWLFAALPLPVEVASLLETLQQAQAGAKPAQAGGSSEPDRRPIAHQRRAGQRQAYAGSLAAPALIAPDTAHALHGLCWVLRRRNDGCLERHHCSAGKCRAAA